ncbi:co-chaperone GroES [Candidatus Saccharibacteria bacterium]|nr:co-chaperone GroES [Candidatus Saccharibacteria bacterium]
MAIKPLKDKVVAIKEAPIKKTSSGILLGEAKETPAYATVEAVGPEVKGIKKGDRIIFKEFSTTAIKIDDKDYIIVAEEDILATL